MRRANLYLAKRLEPVPSPMLWCSVLAVITAYVLGSVSVAILSARLWRLPDPRVFGSGNPGATNMLRTGHRQAAALTLFGDAAKGGAAVVIAQVATRLGFVLEATAAAAAVAVVVGHIWPVFFGFKGGKGVATALGVLFALDIRLGFLALLTWGLVFACCRISSLAALAAALAAPLYSYSLLQPRTHDISVWIIGVLLFYRHRQNLIKIRQGRETAVYFKRPPKDEKRR